MTPIDPADCAKLKSNGVTVIVVYTTYLAMPGIPEYDSSVAHMATDIAPNLQACASSPSWFFEATDGPAIGAAMSAAFQKMGAVSLTQ